MQSVQTIDIKNFARIASCSYFYCRMNFDWGTKIQIVYSFDGIDFDIEKNLSYSFDQIDIDFDQFGIGQIQIDIGFDSFVELY